MSSPQPGGPLPHNQKTPQKNPRKPSSSQRHTLTPLVLFGWVADGAAVLGVIIGRFDMAVTTGALLGAVISLGILLKRQKVHLDRTNWLAITGLLAGAVVLTIMVPQLRAEVGDQPAAVAAPSTSSAPASTFAGAPVSATSSNASTGQETSAGTSTPASAESKQLYAGSPTLKLSQGIDFEKNVISSDLTAASGDIDLYLTNPSGVLTLYPNALNNKLVTNTSAQVETAEHCAIELKQGRPSSSSYVIENESYCFLTSEGHIGLLTVVRPLQDAALVRVLVWDAKLN